MITWLSKNPIDTFWDYCRAILFFKFIDEKCQQDEPMDNSSSEEVDNNHTQYIPTIDIL